MSCSFIARFFCSISAFSSVISVSLSDLSVCSLFFSDVFEDSYNDALAMNTASAVRPAVGLSELSNTATMEPITE